MVEADGIYRILALDGGGMRGYLTARLLQRLEEMRPGWISKVDLFAGTSTGSIIALALAYSLSTREISTIYARDAPKIFAVSLTDRLLDGGGLIGPRYRVRRLGALLRGVFHDLRLVDLDKRVLVPAFRLDGADPTDSHRRWRPQLFHNFPDAGANEQLTARQVALYSSAVPAVFASVDGYVDGGVYAANPTLCAIAQTLASAQAATGGLGIDRLHVLSVGTGLGSLRIEGDRLDWGLMQWARPLLGLVLDAGTAAVDFQARHLLGSAYHRLNPWIEGEPIMLDDVEAIPRLERIAATASLDSTVAWLDQQWMTA